MENLLISCFTALLSAFVAFVVARGQILANFGSQEMQDYNAIKELEQKILDCKIEREKEKDEEIKNIYDEKINILNLQYRNTFEILCDRYLAKNIKIDKENFRKMYKTYIVDLVENDRTKYDSLTSTYEATIKVYKEFKK